MRSTITAVRQIPVGCGDQLHPAIDQFGCARSSTRALPKPSGVVSRQQRLVGRSDADSATKRVRGELENTVASLGSMLGSEVSAGGGKKPIPAAAA